jgi:hypothetical protein
MQYGTLRLASFLIGALAVVVSVDIAPDAAEMLLVRSKGEKDVRIENVFYSCVQGNSFAMVRNGEPAESAGIYDRVEAGGLNVYVPRSMSFEGDVPKIVTFPRRTGYRDVGVPNTTLKKQE